MSGDRGRFKIDYIIVKKWFKNQVKDYRSCLAADIDSGHNLLLMKSNLKYKKLISKKNND